MGRIRTAFIKKHAKEIVAKYFPILSEDFEKNKRILNIIAEFPSKKVRNKVAGYITRLMKTGRAREIWLLRKKE